MQAVLKFARHHITLAAFTVAAYGYLAYMLSTASAVPYMHDHLYVPSVTSRVLMLCWQSTCSSWYIVGPALIYVIATYYLWTRPHLTPLLPKMHSSAALTLAAAILLIKVDLAIPFIIGR
jgi:hypothetical protein